MDIDYVASKLTGAKPCEDLTDAEARRLAGFGSLREAAAGDEVMREGEPGDEMLILLEGRVEAWKKDRREGDLQLGDEVAGEILGEIALLRRGTRMATVKATEPCRFFVLDRAAFERLVGEGDAIAYKIGLKLARSLAERIAWINDTLLDMIANPPDKPDEFEAFKDKLLSQWDF
ncbi:MAG: cyclic nucleotide-binding domain-containing protein [Planctomycetota bacterium]|jgi:CRP-like cAMP-binding protein